MQKLAVPPTHIQTPRCKTPPPHLLPNLLPPAFEFWFLIFSFLKFACAVALIFFAAFLIGPTSFSFSFIPATATGAAATTSLAAPDCFFRFFLACDSEALKSDSESSRGARKESPWSWVSGTVVVSSSSVSERAVAPASGCGRADLGLCVTGRTIVTLAISSSRGGGRNWRETYL